MLLLERSFYNGVDNAPPINFSTWSCSMDAQGLAHAMARLQMLGGKVDSDEFGSQASVLLAVEKGLAENVDILLENGADVNEQDGMVQSFGFQFRNSFPKFFPIQDRTALMLAARNEDSFSIGTLMQRVSIDFHCMFHLLKTMCSSCQGADGDILDVSGKSALMMAVQGSTVETIQSLLGEYEVRATPGISEKLVN